MTRTNIQDPTDPVQNHTLEIWVEPNWHPIEESQNLPAIQRLQEVYSIECTTVPATEDEYLGTFSSLKTYVLPSLDWTLLVERLDRDHTVYLCSCEHDCCGHIINSNYTILAVVPHGTKQLLALVKSEYSINV